ncbi:hypothetical protein ACERIT_13080 [Halopenitus sp. H-Gu1]|uniref:hypothetical protein n=1 Tax=Halopenitus sp. H-Gu1 TaxID=3242697 RepID=UPI00359D09CF
MGMFENTIRYNNNNNKHPVETLTEDFDSILYESHLAAYNQRAVRHQITQLSQDDISYYIDPDLAVFERGNNFRNDEGMLGNWIRAYVNALGEPLKTILAEDGNLKPDRLTDKEITQIATAVVNFQEGYSDIGPDADLRKYSIGDVEPAVPNPKRIVPWYNKIRSPNQLTTTRKILEASQQAAELKLKPCLYIEKDVIANQSAATKMINLLSSVDVDECFLIIENLDKNETDGDEYIAVIDFVYNLSAANIAPHFLYGDYFSHLLYYFGLEGTTYGTLYAEEREEALKSHGGGGMSKRFYFNTIREFLSIPGAADIGKQLGVPVCDCSVCQRHFKDWDDFLETLGDGDADLDEESGDDSPNNALNIAQKHYLEMRWRHTMEVQENSLEEIREILVKNLERSSSVFKSSRQISSRKNLKYISKWLYSTEERKGLAK